LYSAGVGRTGTFIAIDYLLDQAKVEGQVDIYHCVQSMRAKRVNMVQTQEQYNFVYEALLEALKSGDTSISCAVFRRRYRELQEVNPESGHVRLEEEFEVSSCELFDHCQLVFYLVMMICHFNGLSLLTVSNNIHL